MIWNKKVLPFDGCIWSYLHERDLANYHQSTTERDIYTAAACDSTPYRQMHLMKVLEGEKTHLTQVNSRLQPQQSKILEQLASIETKMVSVKSVDRPVLEWLVY